MTIERRDRLDEAIDRTARRMVTAPVAPGLAVRLVAALPARAEATAWREWRWPVLALGGAAAVAVAALVYPTSSREAIAPTLARPPAVAVVSPVAGSRAGNGDGVGIEGPVKTRAARPANSRERGAELQFRLVVPAGLKTRPASGWRFLTGAEGVPALPSLAAPSPLGVAELARPALDVGVVLVAPLVIDDLTPVAALPSEMKE